MILIKDTDGFATLDTKVLSAVTNVPEGGFARQIDSFKEREAHAGRLVRGRQVLAKLDAHFATSALHGSLYEFEDLRLRGEAHQREPRYLYLCQSLFPDSEAGSGSTEYALRAPLISVNGPNHHPDGSVELYIAAVYSILSP